MNPEKLIRMLVEIRDLAGEASLTGTFHNAGQAMAKHYNSYLKFAQDKGYVKDPGLFMELGAESSIDDIGISAALLAAYLKDSSE